MYLGLQDLLGRRKASGVAGVAGLGLGLGNEVMSQCESPKIWFQIFFTRFPQPPRVIVYDNGCKLHVYCLNREPGYFQNTLFLVDRFHWRGHTGCSSGYNLDLYGEPLLKTLN